MGIIQKAIYNFYFSNTLDPYKNIIKWNVSNKVNGYANFEVPVFLRSLKMWDENMLKK